MFSFLSGKFFLYAATDRRQGYILVQKLFIGRKRIGFVITNIIVLCCLHDKHKDFVVVHIVLVICIVASKINDQYRKYLGHLTQHHLVLN